MLLDKKPSNSSRGSLSLLTQTHIVARRSRINIAIMTPVLKDTRSIDSSCARAYSSRTSL